MNIIPGQILEMKKQHPCGGRDWLVLRAGMDFRLRCVACGREVLMTRQKAEKGIKRVKQPPEKPCSGGES